MWHFKILTTLPFWFDCHKKSANCPGLLLSFFFNKLETWGQVLCSRWNSHENDKSCLLHAASLLFFFSPLNLSSDLFGKHPSPTPLKAEIASPCYLLLVSLVWVRSMPRRWLYAEIPANGWADTRWVPRRHMCIPRGNPTQDGITVWGHRGGMLVSLTGKTSEQNSSNQTPSP